jgi:hypothetical protein
MASRLPAAGLAALRGRRFAGVFALVLLAPGLRAQTSCRPPTDLRVCQDQYGPEGRVFLIWASGEPSYTSVRVFADGALVANVPGDDFIAYIDGLSLGTHTFAIEGVCGTRVTPRVSASFTVVASTPYTDPIESMSCIFDPARRRLAATIVHSEPPPLFIDVYILRPGVPVLLYVDTIAGTTNVITVGGVTNDDRLILQFFNQDCYGSQLTGCPGSECLPVADLRVCQDLYGPASRVFLVWLGSAVDYTSFEILLDGETVGAADGRSRLFYVDPVSPGPHVFGVRGLCGAEAAGVVSRELVVLDESPHQKPLENLQCAYDSSSEVLTATWLEGEADSEFIDVYLRVPGASLLQFAGTVAGDRTRVSVRGAGPGDEVVLQFFSPQCYGSPLLSCDPREHRPQGFQRGDANGTAEVDLSDGIASLSYLFLGGLEPLCLDAADANDDGRVDIADTIFTLSWLFGGGPIPPPPGPFACGDDPTADDIKACLTAACP